MAIKLPIIGKAFDLMPGPTRLVISLSYCWPFVQFYRQLTCWRRDKVTGGEYKATQPTAH